MGTGQETPSTPQAAAPAPAEQPVVQPQQAAPAQAPASAPAPATPPPAESSDKTAEQTKAERLAAATVAEKQLQKERAEFRAQVAQFNQQKAELAKVAKMLGDLKTDPLGALQRLGVPDEVIVKQLTSREPPKAGEEWKPEIEKTRKELEATREQLRQQAESMKKAQELQQQRELQDFYAETVDSVNSNPDQYEFLIKYGAQEQVPAFMLAYAREHNKALSFEEAAGMLEKELEERVYSQILPSKKVQAKLAAKPPAPPAAPQAAPSQGQPALASAGVSAAGMNQATDIENMSKADREALALKIMNEAAAKAGGTGAFG